MTISPPAGYTFGPLQPGAPFFDDAARLYIATWPFFAEDEIIDLFTSSFALPEYRGLVAIADGSLVAFGFGTRSLPGQWWHDRLAEKVGATHSALQDAWALVDLATTPGHRGRGLGGALMEALLTSQPCARALLSTEVENATARRLYERYGWSYLHEGFVFAPGDPAFAVMKRELHR